MKKLVTICAVALAMTFVGAGTVSAASGQTNIDITLEPVVILHYYSDIDVTITSEDLSEIFSGATDGAVNEPGTPLALTSNGVPLTLDADISPDTTGDVTSATLTLTNAWAVRALSNNDVTVAIAIDTATLTSGSSGTIGMSNAVVDDGTSSGASINFTPLGLATPEVGDVSIDLDFSLVSAGGDFTGGQFTITATST
jgi:hypothetical protein